MIPDSSIKQVRSSASLRRWARGKAPIFIFIVKLFFLMSLYYAMILWPFADQWLEKCLHLNAQTSNTLLNLLGQHTRSTETIISSNRYAINVRRGCDAIEPAWFLCAAILSFPSPFLKKILGMTFGVAIIFGANIIRIATLFLIGLYYPNAFSLAHLEIWPLAFILLAIGLWLNWLTWLKPIPLAKELSSASSPV